MPGSSLFTPEDSRAFQHRLHAALADVRQALASAAAADTGTVVLDQTSVGRLSRMDALQQQAMASGWKETLLREERRLVAALARFEEGAFGVCCRCGESIRKARLEADPGAPFCTDCQTEIEDAQAGGIR